MSNSPEVRHIDARTEESRDLGFGNRVSQHARSRLLNRDGSFNVNRLNLSVSESLSFYHSLLSMSWSRFYVVIAAAYLGVNLLFALAYFLCGPGALLIGSEHLLASRFLECFFFSVQTFTTIGYGRVSPIGLPANIMVAVEAFSGLLGFAFATALAFARFSRPNAKILFSERAIIAPYQGITAFEFRIINARASQLIDVEAKVVMSRLETVDGRTIRRFFTLPLEREKVSFFPLNWTIVHPIDSQSPLFGVTYEGLEESETEFMVLISGIEETFAQSVHTRTSYKADEVVVGARFADMYVQSATGDLGVDIRGLHRLELVGSST